MRLDCVIVLATSFSSKRFVPILNLSASVFGSLKLPCTVPVLSVVRVEPSAAVLANDEFAGVQNDETNSSSK